MIGMIVGVAAGSLLFLALCYLIWRKIQNKHTLDVQQREHDHEFKMVESRNRSAMLSLANTPEGLRALQNLGVGQIGGATNRLAIGAGEGPHAGGGGGRIFDVSLSQVPYYEILGV